MKLLPQEEPTVHVDVLDPLLLRLPNEVLLQAIEADLARHRVHSTPDDHTVKQLEAVRHQLLAKPAQVLEWWLSTPDVEHGTVYTGPQLMD